MSSVALVTATWGREESAIFSAREKQMVESYCQWADLIESGNRKEGAKAFPMISLPASSAGPLNAGDLLPIEGVVDHICRM